ncbi:MAG: EamA family transporter [Anaerolineales bacterium]
MIYSIGLISEYYGEEMNTPIMLAVVGLFGFGMANFFWKVAGVNNVYSPSFMVTETVIVAVSAILLHIFQKHPYELAPRMVGLASLSGLATAIAIFSTMLALRLGGEGSVIFPIKSMSVVVAVLLSYYFFREPVTFTKVVGLGLGVSSIVVLSR